MSTTYPLALHQRDHPLLVHYAGTSRQGALWARREYKRKTEYAEYVIYDVMAEHQDLERQIAECRVRINNRVQGAPARDGIDAPSVFEAMRDSLSENMTQQEQAARKALLKTAYREAARLAHPDRGGSHEDATMINLAYAAGDLGALQEYVIARNKTIMEQIAYWLTETQKPDIAWMMFQRTEHFKVLRLTLAGKRPLASSLAREIMQRRLAEMLLEELSLPTTTQED